MIDPKEAATGDIEEMIQTQHQQRVQEIKRGYRNDRYLVLTLGLLLFVLALVGPWVATNLLPAPPLPTVVQVQNLGPVGGAQLCPGDVLTYRYELVADSSGVIEIDTSTVRVDAAYFMVPSVPSRVVVDGPMRVPMTERWVVPEYARDPATGDLLQWQPGSYLRTLSVSTPGRNSAAAIGAVPFMIRDNCPARPF